MIRPPPRSPLFPSTPLSRSVITRNAADAEDATQDGLVKAWRALGRFRAGEPLRPWLLQIVANEARNRRRSAGRREHLALREDRKSTRLNSSHGYISYAVFCL